MLLKYLVPTTYFESLVSTGLSFHEGTSAIVTVVRALFPTVLRGFFLTFRLLQLLIVTLKLIRKYLGIFFQVELFKL